MLRSKTKASSPVSVKMQIYLEEKSRTPSNAMLMLRKRKDYQIKRSEG